MYKIIYIDNTEFIGGNPDKSNWNNIADKPIKQIEYTLGNKQVVMKDYDMYNHQVKHAIGIGIVKIIIMGLQNDNVTSIIFNIKKRSIERQNAKLGYEYCGGISTGWKKGIKNNIGIYQILTKS